MLRSTLHASFSYFSPRFNHLKPTQSNIFRRNLTFPGSHRLNRSLTNRGRMVNVLDILGPFDDLIAPPDVLFYSGVLRKCSKSRNSVMGSLTHVHLIKLGLLEESRVSNVLVDLYAKAGLFDECLKLFDEMPARDMISWCTLISGFVSYGLGHEAFQVFRKIHGSGLKANHFIYSSVLKGCATSGDLDLGLQVHGLVVKLGLVFDAFIETGVVNMYAKCGVLSNALKMFYELPVKSLVSWNTMISGYAQNGFLMEAVHLCQEMCQVGFVMDLVTLRMVMGAVSTLEIFDFCKNLHVYSIKIGFGTDSFMVAELVKLPIKRGDVAYMSKLFNSVKKPDPILFSLLIAGYHLNGHRIEAVKLAEELLGLSLILNQGALLSILNMCLFEEEGMQIHARILRTGHESYISVSNALISMYTKFGKLKDANLAFINMAVRDVISWTAIMAGHVQMFQFVEAIKIFHAFRKTEMLLDQSSVATIINACTGIQALNQGRQIHSFAMKLGIEFSDFVVASLLHMYIKCGYIRDASRLFSCIPSPHGLVPTNVMLAGYYGSSQPLKALELFSREYHLGLVPDQFSFAAVLGACAALRSMEFGERNSVALANVFNGSTNLVVVKLGKHIHASVLKMGLASDAYVGKSLVRMYAKLGDMNETRKSSCEVSTRDGIVSESAITGFTLDDNKEWDLKVFEWLRMEDVQQDYYSTALSICARSHALMQSTLLHPFSVHSGVKFGVSAKAVG